ncbi:hypothetical protein [Dongia rigui]|uniref:Uncharacterized protein n=1 Tax=Dongia rigui TaxID=940149 RepID=A0ABU5DUQ3_9PROT|nr:hypothetical protein [Dongia rigui]MDY0871022.1 hypothetical protein [Dongia rigui]
MNVNDNADQGAVNPSSLQDASAKLISLARDIRRFVATSPINPMERVRRDWKVGLLAVLVILAGIVISGLFGGSETGASSDKSGALAEIIRYQDSILVQAADLISTCGPLPPCRQKAVDTINAAREKVRLELE